MADAAYWFDDETGSFVSSDFYFAELPRWAANFNAAKHINSFAGKTWSAGRTLPLEAGRRFNAAVYNSAFGNDLLELFADSVVGGKADREHVGDAALAHPFLPH